MSACPGCNGNGWVIAVPRGWQHWRHLDPAQVLTNARQTSCWRCAVIREQEGVDAAEGQGRSPVIRASEHLSSERRRGLEEAAINYVQRVRSNGNLGESWQALCDAVDRALLLKPSPDPIREEMERALYEIIGLDHHNMGQESRATKIARAALSKHRDHPPAHRSGK